MATQIKMDKINFLTITKKHTGELTLRAQSGVGGEVVLDLTGWDEKLISQLKNNNLI